MMPILPYSKVYYVPVESGRAKSRWSLVDLVDFSLQNHPKRRANEFRQRETSLRHHTSTYARSGVDTGGQRGNFHRFSSRSHSDPAPAGPRLHRDLLRESGGNLVGSATENQPPYLRDEGRYKKVKQPVFASI